MGAVRRSLQTRRCQRRPACPPCTADASTIADVCRRWRVARGSNRARHPRYRTDLSHHSQSSAGLVRHLGVDVHEHGVDACLRGAVLGVPVPRPISGDRLAHIRQQETTPLTSGRQATTALPPELVDQRCLAPLLVAEDIGADLAVVSLVAASDLLAPQDSAVKQPEGITVRQADQPPHIHVDAMMPSPARRAKPAHDRADGLPSATP
jgi:hypothetical protein